MVFCDACKSSDVERLYGQVLCAICGKVLEESDNIVNEVQFLENAQGGSSVSGRLVGADGRFNFGGNLHLGFGRESRQVTLQKAKVRLQGIAAQLRIEELYVSKGLNFFRMALSKGLTKGRKSDYIAAACLYTACRTADKPLPYMLLDFSDALRADVYTLGHVYLKLCKELCILQPTIQVHSPDPAIFIERYADKLEFGEKTLEVAKTATRLVSRMKRDWLVEGRRPSGICGAALLVAARIFNFNRTIRDIMKVVRIGEGTIKKRLTEFEQTPSSQLTVDEFLYQKIDLTEEMDPPSFIEGKRKAKLAELEEKGELPHLMEEVEKLQAELEAAIVETMNKKHKRYRKFMTGDDSSLCSTAPSLADLDEELAQYSSLLDYSVASSIMEDEHSNMDSKKMFAKREMPDRGHRRREDGEEDPERDSEVEAMVERELHGVLHFSVPLGPRPTAASLGIKESIDEYLTTEDAAEAEEDDKMKGELDLTGINDEELDMLILSEDEVKIKTTIWMRENAEFLKEMKEKEERKAKELLENPQPKKKRKMKKRVVKTEARNAGEAIEKMLIEKKLSNKIDYEVVKSLNIIGALPLPPKVEESSTKAEDSLISKRTNTDPDDGSSAKRMKAEEEKAEKEATVVIPDEAVEEDYYDDEEEEYEEEEQSYNVADYVTETYDDYDGFESE